MVFKTHDWYQTVRLDMTSRFVPKVIILGKKVGLSWPLYTMLFVMTSGNLNIDLTQKKLFYKSCRPFNELSNAACRLSLLFVVFEV